MKAISEKIKTGWAVSSRDLAGKAAFWERSALVMLLRKEVEAALTKYGKGQLIDAGAGTLTYKPLVQKQGCSYVGFDFKKTHPELDFVADVMDIPKGDDSFDTGLSVEVLEHVPYPAKALAELFRVIRPGGHLIVTIPHMGYLHNEPYDFFRYTHYGLRLLLTDAGFEVISIKPSGGLISFIQHIPATFLVGVSHGVPLLEPITHFFLKWCSRFTIWLDEKVDKKKLFAVHYIAIAKKPESPT